MILKIRPEQLDELKRDRQQTLRDQIAGLIRRDFPALAQNKPDAELMQAIEASVAYASGYGITTGRGVLAYTALALVAGPQFHTLPDIARLFDGTGSSPDRKIRELMRHSLNCFDDWQREGRAER